MNDMGQNENDRQYNTIDLMINSHALLRDKYKFLALILNIGLLVVSVFICAFVFVDVQLFSQIGLDPQKSKIFLGVLSVICFGLSLIEYRIDLKGKSSLHSDAANRLADLKAQFRDSYSKFKGSSELENKILFQKYNETMDRIIKIPESQFVKLKSKYHYKKILSKMINDYPSTPIILLKIKIRYQGIRIIFDSKNTQN